MQKIHIKYFKADSAREQEEIEKFWSDLKKTLFENESVDPILKQIWNAINEISEMNV